MSIANKEHLNGINRIRQAIYLDGSNGHSLTEIDEYEIECSDDRATFVYHQVHELIGYLTFYKTNLFKEAGDVIMEIFVHPNFQGNGFGTKLIETCINHITDKGRFNRITLSVLNDKVRAISLYERHGFSILREDSQGKYMYREIQH